VIGVQLAEDLTIFCIMVYCIIFFAGMVTFGFLYWFIEGDMGDAWGAASTFLVLLVIISLVVTLAVSRTT
jgi:hypothetical protein